ncbi:MAG TPA: FAD-dependent oxidoreductase [Planctomycetota bacterium]
MTTSDVLVIGAGIAGASFAFHAARAGRRVVVVEQGARAGGCLATARTADGYWYELGAHTAYNSYGAFLELLEGCGLLGELQPRGKPVLRFLEGNAPLPGKNLGLLLRQLDLLELLRAVPRWRGARMEGHSVRAHYTRLVGARNYARVLGPLLGAVPSQAPDDFPAEMLFKRRPRRKDVRRSFTLRGGLARAVEAALAQPGIELQLGCAAHGVERAGESYRVTLEDGRRLEAPLLALAVPPAAAARLLAAVAPRAAAQAARVRESAVESLAFALPLSAVRLPHASFLVPRQDLFHSVVTRDVVPDERWRAFTFHFRPEVERSRRLARASEVLGLRRDELAPPAERRHVLPSPVLGHADTVRLLDEALRGQPLAVSGNWFGGLAIEDCVLRSKAEWRRVGAGG